MAENENQESHITVLMKKYDPNYPLPGQIVGIFLDGHEIRCKSLAFEATADQMGTVSFKVPLHRVEFKMQEEM